MSGILARSTRTLVGLSEPTVARTSYRSFASSSICRNVDPTTSQPLGSEAPSTHFKITLRRSGISMGDKKKGTLLALGFHRRNQTVYHKHTPEAAGMILAVKELLEVENVPDHLVKTKQEMRQDRKATRGYEVVSNKRGSFLNV